MIRISLGNEISPGLMSDVGRRGPSQRDATAGRWRTVRDKSRAAPRRVLRGEATHTHTFLRC
eukprot:scaffold6196_cov113-Isochrysis_galbana.AAC.10